MEMCKEHSGFEARIENLETSTENWKLRVDKAHERIDSMKNWVIAGMTSMVIQLLILIGAIIIAYSQMN